MYTIDEFIERIKELREAAELKGETPVAVKVECDDSFGTFEAAAVELQFVKKPTKRADGLKCWESDYRHNSDQILSVF